MAEFPLWFLYGCSFNSVMLISGDLIDFMFASAWGVAAVACQRRGHPGAGPGPPHGGGARRAEGLRGEVPDGDDRSSTVPTSASATTARSARPRETGPERRAEPSDDEWISDMLEIALTKLLQPLKPAIAKDPEPMKALAYANFEVSHNLLVEQVTSPERVCSEIAVVGGIMVNLPGNLDDKFVPLTFELLDCKTGEITDYFHRFGQTRPGSVFGTSKPREPLFKRQAANIVEKVVAGKACS